MQITDKMIDAYKRAASRKVEEAAISGSNIYDPDIGRAAGIRAAILEFFQTPPDEEIWKLRRVIDSLDPSSAINDDLLRDIHMRLQVHGERHPERMVSVLHRNVVLWAVSDAIRDALGVEGEAKHAVAD